MNLKLSTKITLLSAIIAASTSFNSCKKGEISDDQKESFIKFYGTSSYDQAFKIVEVNDGYIMVGNTTRFGNSSSRNTDISIRKINEFGNELWTNSFGDLNTNDQGLDFIIDDDGGFLITGYTRTLSIYDSSKTLDNVVLLKINTQGNLVWQEKYSLFNIDTTAYFDSRGLALAQTAENYIVVGTFGLFPLFSQNPTDNFAIEINKATRQIPGSGLFKSESSNGANNISNVVQKNDNEFSVIGTKLDVQNNITELEYLKLETNPIGLNLGTVNSQKDVNTNQQGIDISIENGNHYLLSNVDDSPNDVIQLEEFAFTSVDELTLSGNWVNSYNVSNNDNSVIDTYGKDMSFTNDGGILITGYSLDGQDKQVILIKTDSKGNKLWEKTFGSDQQNEQGESVIETSDGGILILCSVGDANPVNLVGNTSVMVIKTTSEGELK